MKYGIAFANTMGWATGAGALDAARAAEAAGFESMWTVEHVVYPDDYASAYPYSPDGKMPAVPSTPIPDPLIWLAYIAGATSTLTLATGILILPQRNPVVLAKELATLDSLSGGRVELGIGVGWLKEEFDALGVPWERRGARTDEYVGAMRALWTSDGASFDGEFASFSRVSSNPKPARQIPIVIGGHSISAAKRAGRLGDGFFPGKGSPAELRELMDVVRQTAADAGRDPSAVELTAGVPPAAFGSDPVGAVEELAAIGVSRLVAPAFALMKPSATEAMANFAERVIAPTKDVAPAPVG